MAGTDSEASTIDTQTTSAPVHPGCVFVLNHDRRQPSTIRAVLNTVTGRMAQGAPTIVCLGPRSTSLDCREPVLTPSEYLLRLLRRYSLHRNEREMLLSEEDQRITVQLCLADRNKQLTGDFDVEVSRVLEFNKRLMKAKLSGHSPSSQAELDDSTAPCDHFNTSFAGFDVTFEDFQQQYADYLKTNNILDMMDLITRIEEERKVNTELRRVLEEQSFLYLQPPANNIVQKSLFSLLSANKPLKSVTIAQSLDESILDPTEDPECSPVTADQILTEPATLRDVLVMPQPGEDIRNRGSVTEAHIQRLVLGYLHLLVNSRSELALARVINTPERDLGHKAFTDIKHEAGAKGMPMYQTIVSYVIKLRLGGRGYAPSADSRLAPHIKGLSEFTDLTQKLQTILEETAQPKQAVQKVLNVIKNTIIKCRDNVLRRQSIEAVRDGMLGQADWVLDNADTSQGGSPGRCVSAGGSLVGRQCLRALRWLLDHAACQPCDMSALDSLTDAVSSQRTPLRFQSVMATFRSPLETSPEAAENQSLAQRMMDKYPVKKCARGPQRSDYSWARPLHDTGLGDDGVPSPLSQYTCLPSKTMVHPGRSIMENSQSFTKRILESVGDQENTDSKLNAPQGKKAAPEPNSTTSKPQQRKRPLADSNQAAPNKKAKVQTSQNSSSQATKPKAKPSKVSKKKAVPLQKGQKTLGAFFRL